MSSAAPALSVAIGITSAVPGIIPRSVICSNAASVNVPSGPRYAMRVTFQPYPARPMSRLREEQKVQTEAVRLEQCVIKLGLAHLGKPGRSVMPVVPPPTPSTAERIRSVCVRATGAMLAVDRVAPEDTAVHHLLD